MQYFDKLITDVGATLVTDILKGKDIDLPAIIADVAKAQRLEAVCRYVEANRQLYFMELGYDLDILEHIKQSSKAELFSYIEENAPNIPNMDHEKAYNAFEVIMQACIQLQEIS